MSDESWPYSPETYHWIELSRDEWKAVAEERMQEIRKLRTLLAEHHAVGALQGAMIGDRCPVCARIGG